MLFVKGKKKSVRILQWAAGIGLSLALLIILLISCFEIAMYADFDFYKKEYEKYDVLSDLGMSMEDTMHVTREMMAYLRGDRETLSVVTTVEGEEQDFFHEQDRFHMGEVQQMFLNGLALRRYAVVLLFVCLMILICSKADVIYLISRSYHIVASVLVVLLMILGIAVARDFNAVFTLFHEIFFDNDLWMFDPATDYMIRMLPEGLFFDFVLRIGGLFAGGLIVLFVVSCVFRRREKLVRGNLRRRQEERESSKNI